MANVAESNSLFRFWLNLLAVVNISVLFVLWGVYVLGGMEQGNLALRTSMLSIVCIVNVVGIVYLYRNLRLGIYLSLGVSLLVLAVLYVLNSEFSWIACASVGCALVSLLLTFLQADGKSIWSQMRNGMDIVHFRHIYQVSVVLVLLAAGFGIYGYVSWPHSGEPSVVQVNIDEQGDMLRELDDLDITLGRINVIEKSVTEIPLEYEARIMALRHLLSAHIVPNEHDVKSFQTAYLLRRDALSPKQQDALDWFFRQQGEVKQIWESQDGLPTIKAFYDTLKRIVKERNITEF